MGGIQSMAWPEEGAGCSQGPDLMTSACRHTSLHRSNSWERHFHPPALHRASGPDHSSSGEFRARLEEGGVESYTTF